MWMTIPEAARACSELIKWQVWQRLHKLQLKKKLDYNALASVLGIVKFNCYHKIILKLNT